MMKGCFNLARIFFSFITELIDFFCIIFALYISFIARISEVFLV